MPLQQRADLEVQVVVIHARPPRQSQLAFTDHPTAGFDGDDVHIAVDGM